MEDEEDLNMNWKLVCSGDVNHELPDWINEIFNKKGDTDCEQNDPKE